MIYPERTQPAPERKPTLAVWKFASCDGCQLTLLNCEDDLLAIAGSLTIASFGEASSEVIDGPYDLSLVEGSITTPAGGERIRRVRAASRFLVTIGACATSGSRRAATRREAAPRAARRRSADPRPARPAAAGRGTRAASA